ncbi:hypothetical protein EMIT0158MI4_20071 [Burkholderia ambifaria]
MRRFLSIRLLQHSLTDRKRLLLRFIGNANSPDPPWSKARNDSDRFPDVTLDERSHRIFLLTLDGQRYRDDRDAQSGALRNDQKSEWRENKNGEQI